MSRFVSSHEVGHTLGVRHNYGSSSTVPVEKLRDKSYVEAHGHTPSIMDYARFNYVAQPEDKITSKGLYPRIGDYDLWAIEWGYKLMPEARTPLAEVPALNKLTIEKLKNNRLWFGTETNPDDPRSQSEDLGDNAMLASTYGIKNLKVILKNLPEWTKTANEGYEDLGGMYTQLTTQFNRYMGHVSKNIGGILETPKTIEQSGPVYKRNSVDTQKEAMKFLNEQLFNTPTWIIEQDILDNTGDNPLEVINKVQTPTLNRLMSATTLTKLITAEAADGKSAYKITDFFSDMDSGIFAELKSNKEIDIFRRNLQKAYVEKMIALIKPASTTPLTLTMMMQRPGSGSSNALSASESDVASVVRGSLKALNANIKSATAQTSGLSKYHLEDLSDRIEKALDPKG